MQNEFWTLWQPNKMQNAKCKMQMQMQNASTSEHLGNHGCPWASQIQAATPAAKKSRVLKKYYYLYCVFEYFLLKIIVFLLLWIQRYDKNNFFTTLPPTSDSILCSVCCVHWWREALLSDLSISSKTFLLDLFICLNGILDFRPEFNDFRPGPLFPVQQQVSRWVGRRPD